MKELGITKGKFKMKKYLAIDGINGDQEKFETIEEARRWLEEYFLDLDEGYHPDFASCKIYQLAEVVECDVIDKKENYKYMYEEEIPEDDNESEAWPYSSDFDEIWKHKFVPVPSELLRQRDELREAMADMVSQFAYRGTYEGRENLHTGGLSALESAFDALGLSDPITVLDFEAAIKNTETK